MVVTGDFNTTENDDPYHVLTSVTEAAPVLVDTKTVAPPESDLTTFRGFKTGRTDNRRFDFIFLSEHFVPASHTVIGESRNGFYPSDHLPVFVSFEKKAEK